MLSSVLNSERAIQVNIQIMRTFTKIREIIMTHKDLQKKIEDMERKYNQQFKVVFDAIKQLLTPPTPPEKPKRQIGFIHDTPADSESAGTWYPPFQVNLFNKRRVYKP